MDVKELYKAAKIEPVLKDPKVAHLVIDQNRVIDTNEVPGLEVESEEMEDGVNVNITVKEGAIISKPVHLCFGMTPKSGVQKIVMRVAAQKGAKTSILSHCIFPNAVNVKHIMDAKINIGEAAEYTYWERHIHSLYGGVEVYPKAIVELEKNARFKTEFELIKGRVGKIDMDYETTCKEGSVLEMTTKVNGSGDDDIKIREVAYLVGEGARGVLASRVAVRENARADIYNKIVATAAYARGHVDCKEIIQGNGVALATPIVEVRHPKAHVTHEAAIGSVDTKQLETLMTRGLSEDEAVELIIDGLLS